MLHRVFVRRLPRTLSPNGQRAWTPRQRSSAALMSRHFASDGGPATIPKSTLLATLPPVSRISHLAEIRAINASPQGKKLVVVDDDPTGTQSVCGFPVLAEWGVEALARELKDETTPGFFLLSNIRALTPPQARERLLEISQNLDLALKSLGRDRSRVSVISRSDSTLRGHYPLDVDCLAPQKGQAEKPVVVLAPFFEAGGRITLNDVHYAEGPAGQLLPCHLTPFAKDASFGYSSSDLNQWVLDKTQGGQGVSKILSLSLHDIRRADVSVLEEKVASAPPGSVVLVNSVCMRDLEAVVLACYRAEALRGKNFMYRSASDLVALRAGLEPLPPLTPDFFAKDREQAQGRGGMVVVGSYVPKSSEQLGLLLNEGHVTGIELDVTQVVSTEKEASGQAKARREKEVSRVGSEAEAAMKDGKDVVVYTSRQLKQDDGQGGLWAGQQISDSLVDIVRRLNVRPRFLIAKGGITSNDTAVHGLGIKRAVVEGPLLPGVPVWSCGEETKFPGLKYVVFPGNVGDARALLTAVTKLRGESSPSPSSSSSSAEKMKAPLATPALRSSRTLDMLHTASKKGSAVGAFNVYNLEGVLAVIRAAEHHNCPALLQVHPSSLAFGGATLLELCLSASRRAKVPIGVHLDHAHDEKDIRLALEVGVDSVMVDGSAMAYDDNLAFTRRMVQLAQATGVPVEAELGRLAGEEDGLSVDEKEAKMTDPAQVREFVSRTGVSLLAVTIGNVHGKYAVQPPVLDWPRLKAIRKETSDLGTLLVLHGASGLPSYMVECAMDQGVCKFNVNTEVREAFLEATQGPISQTQKGGKKRDVLDVMKAGTEAMIPVIGQKMKLFGRR